VQGIQDKCQVALLSDRYLAANLEAIEHSATEAMETVRENLSHLNPIHLAPVNVAACVRAAIAEAEMPAEITVRTENLETLPPVVAGQKSLTLVFTNLLQNAAEALRSAVPGAGGLVTIRGAMRNGWVEISVSDTGPGIPPELHERIFEFNFSGRGSTRPGKLGFGLWWVKTLMARLGGAVQVESDGFHGTTFRLRLPRAEVKS
jgi:signal transduction histidine kinase